MKILTKLKEPQLIERLPKLMGKDRGAGFDAALDGVKPFGKDAKVIVPELKAILTDIETNGKEAGDPPGCLSGPLRPASTNFVEDHCVSRKPVSSPSQKPFPDSRDATSHLPHTRRPPPATGSRAGPRPHLGPQVCHSRSLRRNPHLAHHPEPRPDRRTRLGPRPRRRHRATAAKSSSRAWSPDHPADGILQPYDLIVGAAVPPDTPATEWKIRARP